jgi:hypothetical protein
MRRAAQPERAVGARDAAREAVATRQHERERSRPERAGERARERPDRDAERLERGEPGHEHRERLVVAAPLPVAQPLDRRLGARIRAETPERLGREREEAAGRDARDRLGERIPSRRRGPHDATARAATSRRSWRPSKAMRSQAA